MDKLLLCAVFGCLLVQTESMPADTMSAVNSDPPPSAVTDMASAMYYIKYYNHMDADGTEDDMMDSLKDFQRMTNLPQTGKLDNRTFEMMNSARCGVRDNMGITTKERKRAKRYNAIRRWPEDEITWRLNSDSSNLARTDIKTIMRRSLQVWANIANIKFTEIEDTNVPVDFNIEFYKNKVIHDHPDDQSSFDGPDGTLAHAYFPSGATADTISGDAHFDDDEPFTDDSTGENTGRPDVTMPPYPTLSPGSPDVPPGDCPGFDLDAVVKTSTDGTNFQTFFLKDALVWEHTDEKGTELPQRVGDVFQNLPNNVDAGVYRPDTAMTYFFKGSSYYEYRGTTYVSGPQPISTGFPGIPDDVDTAFVWSGNGKTYFTKGNSYYEFNPSIYFSYSSFSFVYSDGPRDLSDWLLVDANNQPLTRLDAAFQSDNMRTYFFFADQYTRIDDYNFQPDFSYPRNIGVWWFGCQSNADLKGNNSALTTALPSVVLLALSAFLTFTFTF